MEARRRGTRRKTMSWVLFTSQMLRIGSGTARSHLQASVAGARSSVRKVSYNGNSLGHRHGLYLWAAIGALDAMYVHGCIRVQHEKITAGAVGAEFVALNLLSTSSSIVGGVGSYVSGSMPMRLKKAIERLLALRVVARSRYHHECLRSPMSWIARRRWGK